MATTPDKDGFAKDGTVAGDYLAAGRDPKLPRPTIAQLEAILAKDDDVAITILPNGEVQAGHPQETGTLRPLTFRENLGGEY